MRAALLLLTAVAVRLCWSARAVEQCPSYDVLEKIVYLPHPRNCSQFRRCQAGRPVLGHCPPGQRFDPATSACGDAARSACEPDDGDDEACPVGGAPRSTCRYTCECSRKGGSNATCPTKLGFSPALEVFQRSTGSSCPQVAGEFQLSGGEVGRLATTNVTGNASSCPADGAASNVPHFADCSKMVACGAGGSEQVHACPPGQLYSHDVGLCDAPEFVDCPAPLRNHTAPPPASQGCSLGAAPASCQQECTCSVVQGGCPSSIQFSVAVDIFHAEQHPACSREPGVIALGGGLAGKLAVAGNTTRASRCPPGSTGRVYLPDPEDCGKVTLCSGSTERTLSCPARLHFNPRTRSCQPPDPAVCGGPTTTTATTAAPDVVAGAEDAGLARDDVPCPTTWACPARRNSSVPHLSDCTLFCRCVGGAGRRFLGACPPGQHFSARAKKCQAPSKANCRSTCPQISENKRGTWVPEECINQDSQEGVQCRLACNSSYQLLGSESINCTTRGWYGSGGLNHIPSCNTPDELAEAVDKKLNESLTRLGESDTKTAIIFILDESLSVDPAFFLNRKSENFQAQKDLAGLVVKGFPLSEKHSAGVITFSTVANVDIIPRQTSTCEFISQLRNVTFFGGNTDLAAALQLAAAAINSTSPPRKTLVLIVTDGESQTDPSQVAAGLRDAGHVVFSIAVADYDRQQLEPISSTHVDGSKLFFALPDFQLFRHIEYYLRAKYNESATQQCP